MVSRSNKRCRLIVILLLFCYPAFAQQILDEMQLIDISNDQTIRSTVIRDPEQALLIVKTQISTLRIQSNNIITVGGCRSVSYVSFCNCRNKTQP